MVSAKRAASNTPARTKKDVVVEFRREMILEAASHAFARAGYEGTSVDSIATEAGIAKGTVYLYFHSKAEIYLAALMHDFMALHEETRNRFAAGGSCKEKIEAFIRIRLAYVERKRDFCRIYLNEFGNVTIHPASIQNEVRGMYRSQADLLASVIAEGIAAGEIRPLPVQNTAFAIYDLTRGLLEKRLLGLSVGNPDTDVNLLMEILWGGLSHPQPK